MERRAVLGQVGALLGGLGALSFLPSGAAAKGVKVCRSDGQSIGWTGG